MAEYILEMNGITKTFPGVKALDNVNLKVKKGETIGVIGGTGSGKSTLVNLIPRFYDVTRGRVLVDGIDVRDMEPEKLRSKIGMVLQKAVLFRGTIRENLFWGNEGATDEEIWKALETAQAKEFVEQKEDGLDTMIEQEGRNLSGGQRQRIGIARALAVDPKFIVCDEPVSALDVSIQAQVVNLMKDIQEETQCAYLFIAHDLSMVKYISDRIGVLHLGYMVESGTKEEIFSHPVHPYTKSLLSAIPHPNPVVEKHRVALTYNYATSGIDYAKGTEHSVGGTHTVLATDEEFDAWTK